MSQHSPRRLLHAALHHAHKTDEPRHEAGDLQDVVLACFNVMDEAQKQRVFQDFRVEELLTWGEE